MNLIKLRVFLRNVRKQKESDEGEKIENWIRKSYSLEIKVHVSLFIELQDTFFRFLFSKMICKLSQRSNMIDSAPGNDSVSKFCNIHKVRIPITLVLILTNLELLALAISIRNFRYICSKEIFSKEESSYWNTHLILTPWEITSLLKRRVIWMINFCWTTNY